MHVQKAPHVPPHPDRYRPTGLLRFARRADMRVRARPGNVLPVWEIIKERLQLADNKRGKDKDQPSVKVAHPETLDPNPCSAALPVQAALFSMSNRLVETRAGGFASHTTFVFVCVQVVRVSTDCGRRFVGANIPGDVIEQVSQAAFCLLVRCSAVSDADLPCVREGQVGDPG